MITDETIARVKSSLQTTKSFTALEVIEELEKENEELKAQLERISVTNFNVIEKEKAEVKTFCKELIKTNNELRNSLRKYEIVPNVDYLPNGSEVYKENVGNNPYGVK